MHEWSFCEWESANFCIFWCDIELQKVALQNIHNQLLLRKKIHRLILNNLNALIVSLTLGGKLWLKVNDHMTPGRLLFNFFFQLYSPSETIAYKMKSVWNYGMERLKVPVHLQFYYLWSAPITKFWLNQVWRKKNINYVFSCLTCKCIFRFIVKANFPAG